MIEKSRDATNQSAQPSESSTVREEITVQNATDKENPLILIESNISSDILQRFKNNNYQEWTDELEYKELYNFWLSVSKKSNESHEMTSITPPVSATSDSTLEELVGHDPSFFEKPAQDNNSIMILAVDDTSHDPLEDSNVVIVDVIPVDGNGNEAVDNVDHLPPDTDFLPCNGHEDLNTNENSNATQLSQESECKKVIFSIKMKYKTINIVVK